VAKQASVKTKKRKPRGATVKQRSQRFDWQKLCARAVSIVLHSIPVALIALVVVTTPVILSKMPIESIEASGDFFYVEKNHLETALEKYLQHSFFTVPMKKIKRDVESIPWVASASVSRKWPGSLHISINERVAIARWNTDELISQRGELFKPEFIDESIELPRLYGDAESAPEVMQRFQEITQMIRPLRLSIETLMVTPRKSLSVGLSNGIQLVVDRTDSMKKLSKFAALYRQLNEIRPSIATVDLRYRNGMAVTWMDVNREAERVIGAR